MTYEQRLNLSKGFATLWLVASFALALGGGATQTASAEYAVLIFSIFVFCQGLILLWHNRLFGTGRSVRLAMALTMGICVTRMITLGVDVSWMSLFLAALLTSGLSIRRGKRPVTA